jgi:hypothetical protein
MSISEEEVVAVFCLLALRRLEVAGRNTNLIAGAEIMKVPNTPGPYTDADPIPRFAT